jgi:hypothetical protein
MRILENFVIYDHAYINMGWISWLVQMNVNFVGNNWKVFKGLKKTKDIFS